MYYLEKPDDFEPRLNVVSCFVECGNEILLLQRHPEKPAPLTWGVPAGKMDAGDKDLISAICRELYEETGISANSDQISYFGQSFVRQKVDFNYHVFKLNLERKPEINISVTEHIAYQWIHPKNALGLDLIQDEDVSIKHFYGEDNN